MIRLILLPILANGVLAAQNCKATPLDSTWPSDSEWAALNSSIDGRLLRTAPVASSCWPGNPFNSSVSCDVVKEKWSNGLFHAAQPESIDYPLFANNSCLPPGASGYVEGKGCELGGLPDYIVNATTEQHVATAMKWASQRNIRITVKGTGHDLNGRSTGAYSLSIWTRNFNHITYHDTWTLPSNATEPHVISFGSGNGWGPILTTALQHNRVVTTGQDPSVGPGGYIQGGGHGPLSRTYGLGAHQVLQATIITTNGTTLTANAATNPDLFWALRGGGGGQYGVVTEYVIKTHPAPRVTMGTLSLVPSTASPNASWPAAAALLALLPSLQDAGFAGAATLATGASATKFSPALDAPTSGVVATQVLWGLNMTTAAMTALIDPVVAAVRAAANGSVSVAWAPGNETDYATFFAAIAGSESAGSGAVTSSRLLGRRHLDGLPWEKLTAFLRRGLAARNQTAGTFVTVGLQGGPGVAGVEEGSWGAVNPVWRDAYLHFIATGAGLDDGVSPREALREAAVWMEEVKERNFREWAPDMGAYMNEANPYNSEWKHDFYGEYYDRLVEIKRKYDPTESLFVLNGVDTEDWEYNLDTGKLCKST